MDNLIKVIINKESFEKARNEIKKLYKENKENQNKNQQNLIVFSSENDELNRKILEKERIDILLLNLRQRKDRIKQRDSGFNQVLAKAAKSNNIKIGINFDEIADEKDLIEKARIFSRIRQNIKLCNKNKINMVFIIQKKQNERNIYDLKSLGSVMGMPSWMLAG